MNLLCFEKKSVLFIELQIYGIFSNFLQAI